MARLGRSFPINRLLRKTIPLVSHNYTSIFTDIVTMADNFTALSVSLLDLTDIVTMTDSIRRDITRVFSDTVTITENFLKLAAKFFADVVTTTDVISTTRAKNFTDTITMSDIATKILNGSANIYTYFYTSRGTEYSEDYQYTPRGNSYTDQY